MMLGSKGILPPMIHGLLRISCSHNPKNIRILGRGLKKRKIWWIKSKAGKAKDEQKDAQER